MKKAAFLDRDGTLNRMVYDETHGLLDSPRRPEQVQMMPGAGRFIFELKRLGYSVIVVTNQPGIAKNTLTVENLDAVNAKLMGLLKQDGAVWDALYSCPHHPEGEKGNQYVCVCECRKPEPGMLVRASQDHSIDLSSSWMIGDGLNDVKAGRAAGCRTVLLTRLKIEQIERFLCIDRCEPDVIASDFGEVLRTVCEVD